MFGVFKWGNFSKCCSAAPSPTPKYEAREEPEKIKKWREEQVERLEEKGNFFWKFLLIVWNVNFCVDKEEEKKKQEWREIAKKELEEWYRNHEEAIAKTKAANRYVAFLFYLIFCILTTFATLYFMQLGMLPSKYYVLFTFFNFKRCEVVQKSSLNFLQERRKAICGGGQWDWTRNGMGKNCKIVWVQSKS